MRKGYFVFCLVGILVLGFTASGLLAGTSVLADSNANIDYGRIDNSTYFNDYFGLTIPIPESWSIQNNEVMKQLQEQGKKVFAGKDQNLKNVLDAAEQNTLNLLTMFQHPLGSAVRYNPSFDTVAEKVSLYPGIQKGSDYLFLARQFMQSGKVKFQFEKEIYAETIGNRSFDVLEAKLNFGQITITQKYYATILKKYALVFILSYTTEEELDIMNGVIQSIQVTN